MIAIGGTVTGKTDIREILDLYGLGDNERAQKRKTLEKFRNQVKEFENQREDIEIALGELQKGIDWLENDLAKIGPANDQARNVAAYDAVARKQLDDA